MDENWAEALQGFEGVWQRVQGGPVPQQPETVPDAGMEEQFIRAEAEGECQYTALARLTDGRCADTFAAMAAECRRSMKRLQTEFFLKTGDTCPPQTVPMPCDGALGYLRRAYLREGKTAQDYLRASASADRDTMRALYGDLSRLCTRRREKLVGLAGMMLG